MAFRQPELACVDLQGKFMLTSCPCRGQSSEQTEKLEQSNWPLVSSPVAVYQQAQDAIPDNYRPISNLQFILKVLERVVNEQLMLHLRINDLLPEHQSAYRSCHSTETALLKVTSDALLAADQGKLTLLGMLDMSAAFDCVDHIILVRRLNVSFSIDENALDWIVSYITGRRQYVRYNGRTSDISVVECGVPQGSDRSISSFSLQMSSVLLTSTASLFTDMPMTCRSTTTASSTTCTTSHPGLSTASVVSGCGWRTTDSSSTRRKLNSSGSVRRLAKCSFESIVVNGTSILPSKTVRNLGVVLDPSLSLAAHVTKLTSTLYFHIRQLRTIRRTLTNDACHALIRALVLSRLDYCNGLLAKALDYLLAQLSGVMRAAARLILQLPRKSHVSDAICCQLHWLDILERVRFKLCVLAHQCIHGLAPSYLSKYWIPVSSITGRSHLRSAASGDLFIPATNTVTIGPRAFAVACPAAWNSLPTELHDKSLSLMTFRKKLKTYLFKTNS